MLCYLTRAVVPGFEVFAFGLVDFAQLIAIGPEDVRRGENMRDVVMETEVVVDDGMGDVIVPATIIFSGSGLRIIPPPPPLLLQSV